MFFSLTAVSKWSLLATERPMEITLTSIKNSMLSRLLAGLAVVLFFAWFILPCCHCQWDTIFGNSPKESESSKPAFGFQSHTDAQLECHCDDHPPKTFEHAVGEDHLFGFRGVSFVSSVDSHFRAPVFRLQANLTRGPPPGVDQPKFGEQRAYVRHRSLLL